MFSLLFRRAGVAAGFALASNTACFRDSRDIHAARAVPERVSSGLESQSWGICELVGPNTGSSGIYGSDLGFTVQRPGPGEDRLAMLFGDTWAKAVDACQYPFLDHDDLQASLPARRPTVLTAGAPSTEARAACGTFAYEQSDAKEPTSWQRIRLFPNTGANGKDAALKSAALRTPVAAFSDGVRLYAVFHRNDPAYCDRSHDCPKEMQCSTDRAYRGKALGQCALPLMSGDAAPAYCRDDSDCPAPVRCKKSDRGVCLSKRPFEIRQNGRVLSPGWYREDPRRGIARRMYFGAAVWPDRPADYGVVHVFATNRFTNVATRTVAHFDPENAERNDYRPGFHTLLVWGRPSFVETGGAQSLPFLFYQPLAELKRSAGLHGWAPSYFAGYGASGKPRWSAHESDAQPIYGADASVVEAGGPRIEWMEPEFDYVNQMALSYVAPLDRWVMFYGGDVPAFFVLDPASNKARDPIHLQRAPGAIHLRTAPHPWGRMTRDRPLREGWSSFEPVLTRRDAARYLACGDGGKEELPGCVEDADPQGPLDLIASLAALATRTKPGKFFDTSANCLGGEVALAGQDALSGNPIGRLYGANIIDEWTDDVTNRVSGLSSGERAVEIYWNASTWSPYQVVLFKTQLRAAKLAR
jgi:hypothetical protein